MELILLGTGSPKPDPGRQGPALLIRIGDDSLLFDAGRSVATQLAKAGLMPEDLHSIFVTHHHFDHICNLDDVIMSAWNNTGQAPPLIFGPQGTENLVRSYLGDIYSPDIETRLCEAFEEPNPIRDIREITEVRDVGPGLVCETENWEVQAAGVEHMYGLGVSRDNWKCLGYRVQAGDRAVAISGDTVDCDGLQHLARDADVLVQCCHLAKAEINTPDWEKLTRYTLACAPQVGRIAARAGVKKLVLTHLREKSAELLASIIRDVRQDYGGEVVIGEDLLKIEI